MLFSNILQNFNDIASQRDAGDEVSVTGPGGILSTWVLLHILLKFVGDVTTGRIVLVRQ